MIQNNNFLFVIILSLLSCCGKEDSVHKKSNILKNEIHNAVDSISDNLPDPYNDYLYTVTYQKNDGKNYIKISIAEYFNKDSVFMYEVYNEHLLIFYSKNFFEKNFAKLDTVGLKQYNSLAYNEERLYMYHPIYEVIEILNDDKFRVLPLEEVHEKKLFYFSDVPEIPEPVPNDSLNNESNIQNK